MSEVCSGRQTPTAQPPVPVKKMKVKVEVERDWSSVRINISFPFIWRKFHRGGAI
jgi:hypothetical protein